MKMIQRILLSLLLVTITTLSGYSSEQITESDYPIAPDNEAILRAVIDSSSPYYYPVLFARYITGDMTLNIEEYRHLYYGYVYQQDYRPLESSSASDRILNIIDSSPTLGEKEFQSIIDQGHEIMLSEPFNPSMLNFLTYAYGQLGDEENELINAYRFRMVLETIKSTGTGLTEKSPWHVLYFSHSSDLFATLGVQLNKRLVVSRTVEYLSILEPENRRLKGYYFDYSRVYMNRPENYDGKQSNGLQFNGITIKERK